MSYHLVSGGSGSIAERSTNLVSGNFTAWCWACLYATEASFSAIFSRVDNTTPVEYDLIGFAGGTNDLTVFGSGGGSGQESIRILTIGWWFFVGLRVEGANNFGYTRYMWESRFTRASATAESYTPARISLGTDYFGDPVPSVRVGHWTVANVLLSETELLRQSYMSSPRIQGITNMYVPYDSTAHRFDRSGRGNTPVPAGTAALNAPVVPFPTIIEASARYWMRAGAAFNPALMAAMHRPWRDTVFTRPRIAVSGMTPSDLINR